MKLLGHIRGKTGNSATFVLLEDISYRGWVSKNVITSFS